MRNSIPYKTVFCFRTENRNHKPICLLFCFGTIIVKKFEILVFICANPRQNRPAPPLDKKISPKLGSPFEFTTRRWPKSESRQGSARIQPACPPARLPAARRQWRRTGRQAGRRAGRQAGRQAGGQAGRRAGAQLLGRGRGGYKKRAVTIFPPMRAWLEQPHGRRHKAPPCILTTTGCFFGVFFLGEFVSRRTQHGVFLYSGILPRAARGRF